MEKKKKKGRTQYTKLPHMGVLKRIDDLIMYAVLPRRVELEYAA